jgi:hypothetical protein
MSRFRVVIQRIDGEGETARVTDLDRIDVPASNARFLEKETALDHLEAQTLASGHEVMRHLLTRQWERVDAQLVAHYQHTPTCFCSQFVGLTGELRDDGKRLLRHRICVRAKRWGRYGHRRDDERHHHSICAIGLLSLARWEFSTATG